MSVSFFGVCQEIGSALQANLRTLEGKTQQCIPLLSLQHPWEVADGALLLPPVPPAQLPHDPPQPTMAECPQLQCRRLCPCVALQEPKSAAAWEWGLPGVHVHGPWLGGLANLRHTADAVIICPNLHGLGTSPTASPSKMGITREDAAAGLGAAAEVGEESLCPRPGAQPGVLVQSH